MPALKIAGVCMVRNEADIVRTAILHHLNVGVDEILVLDNGSTDATPRILRGLRAVTGRVRWRLDDGPFKQQEATTELARDAARRGATWVVIFDADEFWWSKTGDLRAVLSRLEAGVVEAPVVNYIQRREQRDLARDALLTMTRRVAVPLGPRPRARELVEADRIGFLEMEYPPKCVPRATRRMVVEPGAHMVRGVSGARTATDALACLHAPLRAFAILSAKAEHGRRLLEGGLLHADQGWHVRRWAQVVEEGRLEEEWMANSYADDVLDVSGDRRPVVVDTRLREAVAPFVGFTRGWVRAARVARAGGVARLGRFARRRLRTQQAGKST